MEKAALQQLLVHREKNAPLPKFQSGFRKYHSTETALLKVQTDILMSMDNKEVTLLVLLDLSAAFDTIEHSILLNILQQDFGVVRTALNRSTHFCLVTNNVYLSVIRLLTTSI